MATLAFPNGDTLPMLGLGTFKSEPGSMYNIIKKAILLGYQHIDCAPVYGNQAEIGTAISDAITEGITSREKLWITSKLWNDNHAPEDVEPAIEHTLRELRLDYLDLYLVHWPVVVKKGMFLPETGADLISLEELPINTTWKAMERLVEKGLCRHIGVSNFSTKKLADLLESAKIKPEVNQIELHPYLRQEKMFDFCKRNSIFLTAYSPLGSPDRPERLKETGEPVLMQEPILLSLAQKHSCDPAQILLSWLLHKGAAVIPKSSNVVRMKMNLEAQGISLSKKDSKLLDDLDRHRRYYNGTAWTIPGSPYSLANLWDE